MREVNFSIPNVNKASVGITTALYDRRALDCTSTLPLINSLNNLAYLTTSSGRIRDILTVDGGVERLVCILKEGRSSKDAKECWKWNLAFQCVVNIGVRGSEAVRTRVVEADMVPVIATILHNYIQVIDKCRENDEAENMRSSREYSSHSSRRPRTKEFVHNQQQQHQHNHNHHPGFDRIRRAAPPPIEIPAPGEVTTRISTGPSALQSIPAFSLSSPPDRSTFARGHQHHRSHDERTAMFASGPSRATIAQPLMTSLPTMGGDTDTFGFRPVRDVDRLPSTIRSDIANLPISPITPGAPLTNVPLQPSVSGTTPSRPSRRPSIRHQLSVSGVSDDGPASDDAIMEDNVEATTTGEPIVGIQNDVAMRDMADPDSILDTEGAGVRLDQPAADTVEETFNIARSVLEGSAMPSEATPVPTNMNAAAVAAAPNFATLAQAPQMQLNPYARFLQERNKPAGIISSMPRDEDVLMCLQLLAYVSKYCNLRQYFQCSHLVPKLKVPASELAMLDNGRGVSLSAMIVDDIEVEEYLQEDDFNIFPLVEKFTVRHHTGDMQYWAGVVMRNLCRKDDARGGKRQCAYYLCGKWEEWQRQFAKCRRCRRTKYCSKECQKNAWIYHRHWCSEAQR